MTTSRTTGSSGGVAANPFLVESTLPYLLPDFGAIREEHYGPAFEAAMAEQLAQIAAIVGSGPAGAAGFSDTIVALERSGGMLRRVSAVFLNQCGSYSNPETDALDARFRPLLAAHRDAILLDSALFERISALYARRDSLVLDAESLRLLERYYSDFVRAGALLDAAGKERLRTVNARLATLAAAFEQDLFADTRERAVVFDRASELAGLPESMIAAAAENGRVLGHPGKFVISLKLFSNQSQLALLESRDARARLLAASLGRGLETTGKTLVEIATLRAERAALLGFESHAAYVVADQTALTVGAVEEMLGRLVPVAVAKAGQEAAALRASAGFEIEAHDWAFYAEQVRRERYDFESAELSPYLELDRVLFDGVFHAAGQVYGITFTERPDLAGFHPDTRVFEVFDADGTGMGLYLADFYARSSKRGGAWMDEFVSQSHLLGQRPVVLNNLNIAKPPAGQPTLLTFDEVGTLFHEFGHALHGLFSDVHYPYFSGTGVPRDFVEFPSQVNEIWAVWPSVLANYARHHETGAPLPGELLARLTAAERFGWGFRTVEYLGAALLDWAWHTIGPGTDPGDPVRFEAAALAAAGVAVAAIPPRYRSTYFAHIFAGGYSAGYYSYIWSEVLDAQTSRWFEANAAGGVGIRESGERFRRGLLSRGGSRDAITMFRDVVGDEPRIEPLLERRGLV
ncbi:MAG TPA: M3 family metallopeptidase [Actinocrinis sp.]|nr:M3 family metallopeptidase [Actinocrinis sp.]